MQCLPPRQAQRRLEFINSVLNAAARVKADRERHGPYWRHAKCAVAAPMRKPNDPQSMPRGQRQLEVYEKLA